VSLPDAIRPIPHHPGISIRYGDEFAGMYVECPDIRAWSLPGGVVILSNIVKDHKAHLEFMPWVTGDTVTLEDNDVRAFLVHVIKLYGLRVIYAIVPVEGASLISDLAIRLGFKQDGVLRDNRLSPDGFAITDDLIFTLKTSWLRSGPRLLPPA
jgi:hypothetical protein